MAFGKKLLISSYLIKRLLIDDRKLAIIIDMGNEGIDGMYDAILLNDIEETH